MSRKSKGYAAEQLVKGWYIDHWWKFLFENRTIRWGEIDLIMQSPSELCFIEVKAVHFVDDIHNYITRTKIRTLKRSVETFYHRNTQVNQYLPRVDVVFVKNNAIVHIFEYCAMDS